MELNGGMLLRASAEQPEMYASLVDTAALRVDSKFQNRRSPQVLKINRPVAANPKVTRSDGASAARAHELDAVIVWFVE